MLPRFQSRRQTTISDDDIFDFSGVAEVLPAQSRPTAAAAAAAQSSSEKSAARMSPEPPASPLKQHSEQQDCFEQEFYSDEDSDIEDEDEEEISPRKSLEDSSPAAQIAENETADDENDQQLTGEDETSQQQEEADHMAQEEQHDVPRGSSAEYFFLMYRLGFPGYEDAELAEQEKAWERRNQGNADAATKYWGSYLMNKGGVGKQLTNAHKAMRKHIRSYAIPSKYRSKIWMEVSGARKRWLDNEGYYRAILEAHADHDSKARWQIELDLSRTFPTHPYFIGEDSDGRRKMRRVLTAFSWRNPFVAYCQSLNYIVGLLLLHYNEEQAFWMLVVLLEEILPPNYYSPTLKGLRIDSKVLEFLVKDRLPKLHAHFKKLNMDISVFSTGWLLKLYVEVFPIHTVLRIWDLLFNEGNKILFRVALAYLKLQESTLMQCESMGDVLHSLNESTHGLFDYNLLLKYCFSFYSLKREYIEQLRVKFKPVVEREEAEMDAKRKEYEQRKAAAQSHQRSASLPTSPANDASRIRSPTTFTTKQHNKTGTVLVAAHGVSAPVTPLSPTAVAQSSNSNNSNSTTAPVRKVENSDRIVDYFSAL